MESQSPRLSREEAQALLSVRPAPRVTKESIEAKICGVQYIVQGHLTVCLLTMRNGHISSGQWAPPSAAAFDAEVGQRFAYDAAFDPLWQLEAYVLRDQLYVEESEVPAAK